MSESPSKTNSKTEANTSASTFTTRTRIQQAWQEALDIPVPTYATQPTDSDQNNDDDKSEATISISSTAPTAPSTTNATTNTVSLLDKYSNLQSDRASLDRQLQEVEWELQQAQARLQTTRDSRKQLEQQAQQAKQDRQAALLTIQQELEPQWQQVQAEHKAFQEKYKIAQLQWDQAQQKAKKDRQDFAHSIRTFQNKCQQVLVQHQLEQQKKTNQDNVNADDDSSSSRRLEQDETSSSSASRKESGGLTSETCDTDHNDSSTTEKSASFQKCSLPNLSSDSDSDDQDDALKQATPSNPAATQSEREEDDCWEQDCDNLVARLESDKERLVPLLAFALVEQKHGYSAVLERPDFQEVLSSVHDTHSNNDKSDSPSSNPAERFATPDEWVTVLRHILEEPSDLEQQLPQRIHQVEQELQQEQEQYEQVLRDQEKVVKEHKACQERMHKKTAETQQLEGQLERVCNDIEELEAELEQVQANIQALDRKGRTHELEDTDEEDEDTNGKDKTDGSKTASVRDQAPNPSVSAVATTQPVKAKRARVPTNPYLRTKERKLAIDSRASVQSPSKSEHQRSTRGNVMTEINRNQRAFTRSSTSITPGSSAKKRRTSSQKDTKRQPIIDKTTGAGTNKRTKVHPDKHEVPRKEPSLNHSRGGRQYPHRVGRVFPSKDFGTSLSLNSGTSSVIPEEMLIPASSTHLTQPGASHEVTKTGHQPITINNLLLDDCSSSSTSSASSSDSSTTKENHSL